MRTLKVRFRTIRVCTNVGPTSNVRFRVLGFAALVSRQRYVCPDARHFAAFIGTGGGESRWRQGRGSKRGVEVVSAVAGEAQTTSCQRSAVTCRQARRRLLLRQKQLEEATRVVVGGQWCGDGVGSQWRDQRGRPGRTGGAEEGGKESCYQTSNNLGKECRWLECL